MSKILFWDIETQKLITQTFSLYPDSINHEDIIRDWYIICGAWVFNDNKQVKAVSVMDNKARFTKDPCDDKYVVTKLHEVISQADIIVHHNGDKFDWKKFNARVIYHGLTPLPEIQMIDTLKLARRHFAFTSNRLDYLGRHLGLGQKIETAKGLWEGARLGDKKAINQMVKYNKQDVLLLREVYKKLKPYVRLPFTAIDKCPKCESDHLTKQGIKKTKTNSYQKWQCQDCGSWSQSRLPMKLDKPTIV